MERSRERIRAEVSGTRALAAVRAIASHHRIQATQGYEDAARWLEEALRAAGLQLESEQVAGDGHTRMLGCPMPEGWACERAEATLHAGGVATRIADFDAAPLSLIQRSSSGDGLYDLVAIEGGGAPEDYDGIEVRGCVVLVNGPVQRAHEFAVLERGAAGLLSDGRRLLPPTRTIKMDRDSLAYTSFWWQGEDPRGWGFVASPDLGAELRARLARGERLQLEVVIRSSRHVQPITLVTATLPGTLPGEVLITSHLCHPKPGANDNASGAATTLEAARTVAAIARAGGLPGARRTIRFLWMPEFTGTYAWLAGENGRAARTVAALNLDMVGADQDAVGSTQLLECAPHFLGSFAEPLLARIRYAAWDPARARPRSAEVRYSGGSDHALWIDPAAGVPCPMLIQWPDRFYHSDLDTPERCDPESLAHAARCAATYAVELACADAGTVNELLELCVRDAHRRMRMALAEAEPRVRARAERVRGQAALASVSRLGYALPREHPVRAAFEGGLAAAMDALESLFESEIEPALVREPPIAIPAGGLRRPVRLQPSLLLPMRHWQQGWQEAGEHARRAFQALEDRMPTAMTTIDLAWFAADGERRVVDIALALRGEGWDVAVADLDALFEWTALLGASAWGEADVVIPER